MPYIATWLDSNAPNLASLTIHCEEIGPDLDPDLDLREMLEHLTTFRWEQTSFERWKAVDDAFREVQLPSLQKVQLRVRWRDWEYPQPHRIREVMPYLAVERNILEVVDVNKGWIRNGV